MYLYHCVSKLLSLSLFALLFTLVLVDSDAFSFVLATDNSSCGGGSAGKDKGPIHGSSRLAADNNGGGGGGGGGGGCGGQ